MTDLPEPTDGLDLRTLFPPAAELTATHRAIAQRLYNGATVTWCHFGFGSGWHFRLGNMFGPSYDAQLMTDLRDAGVVDHDNRLTPKGCTWVLMDEIDKEG